MKRGPPKTPAMIAKLRGNPNKGKGDNKKVIPEGRGQLWAPPKWFDREQRKQWVRSINDAPVGLLTGSDHQTLVMWTVACVEYVKAALQVRSMGQVIKVGADEKGLGGRVITNPYLHIMNQQIAIIVKTGSQLGFSPASRASLGSDALDPGGPMVPRIAGNAKINAYIDANPDLIIDP